MVGQPSFAKQFIRHVKNKYKYKYKNILQYTPNDILTLEFANIIANLWAYNNINIPNFMDEFTALTFKNALGCTNWQFANFNPNDAKDVFIQLCNSLHSALNSNHNIYLFRCPLRVQTDHHSPQENRSLFLHIS